MAPTQIYQPQENDDINTSYEPTQADEVILQILKDQWRVSPRLIREILAKRAEEEGLDPDNIRKQYINTSLHDLETAGWIENIVRGLYDFRHDPRDGTDDDPDISKLDPRPMMVMDEDK